jgi:AcrR family transcriptional regulator
LASNVDTVCIEEAALARDPREVTRTRILQAARRLFLARGFTRVTIEDVAAKAGYTRGAVYSNFAGKGELFLALVEERFEAQHAGVAEDLPRAATPVQHVDALARRLAAEAAQSREWLTAEVEFTAYAAADPQLSVRVMEAQRQGRAALATLLDERCRAIGISPTLPADELAVVVSSLTRGLTIEYLVDLTTDVPGLLAGTLRRLLGVAPD